MRKLVMLLPGLTAHLRNLPDTGGSNSETRHSHGHRR